MSKLHLAILLGVLLCAGSAAAAKDGKGGKGGKGGKKGKITWPAPTKGFIVAEATLAPIAAANMTKGKGGARLEIGNGTGTVRVALRGAMTGVYMAHVHLGNATTAGPIRLGVLPAIGGPVPVAYNPRINYSGSLDFAWNFTAAHLLRWMPGNANLTVTNSSTEAFGAILGYLPQEMLYFNVHTTAFPGGETRGQFKCVDGCKPTP